MTDRFYARRADSGKVTTFRGCLPLFNALVLKVCPAARSFVAKTRLLVAVHGEDFVILACTVLIGLQSVTDRRAPDNTESVEQKIKGKRIYAYTPQIYTLSKGYICLCYTQYSFIRRHCTSAIGP